MKRLLISVAASLLLIFALVGSAVAAEPGCSTFGAVTADLAQSARPFGQVISSFATRGQGVVSGIVASEHATMCAHP